MKNIEIFARVYLTRYNLSPAGKIMDENKTIDKSNLDVSIKTENNLELAGLESRILAFIIDIAIIIFFFMVISQILFYFDMEGEAILLGFVIGIFLPLYFIPFEMRTGQSPGKKLSNIKVVDNEFNDIGLLRALVRNITKSFPFWAFVGVLLILLTKNKQRLGDMMAGTFVIKVKKTQD